MESIIETKIKKIVSEIVKMPVSKITLEDHFDKYHGVDSLDQISIIMRLEDEFNLDIDDADAEKFKTVSDAVEYIKSRVK